MTFVTVQQANITPQQKPAAKSATEKKINILSSFFAKKSQKPAPAAQKDSAQTQKEPTQACKVSTSGKAEQPAGPYSVGLEKGEHGYGLRQALYLFTSHT